jgi:AraC-like DNA-binding protein
LPTAIICSDDQGQTDELVQLITHFPGWNIYTLDTEGLCADFIEQYKYHSDIHFLIYDKKLDNTSVDELIRLRQQMPLGFIIYYHPSLLTREYKRLTQLEVNDIIIGVHRYNHLKEMLPKLWRKHWKCIPDAIYPAEASTLTPRAMRILYFIENHPLRQCNIQALSEHLQLSQSHFRAEFRIKFGINFRNFKQKLFSHYESVLLLNNKLKPTDIYPLLNYANPANFSRSFKLRHGNNWRKVTHENTQTKYTQSQVKHD